MSFAQLKEFSWLAGTWKLERRNTFEVWCANDETQTLSGRSFQVEGSDTTITETISLKFLNDSYHYIPDLAGNQPPVDFIITNFDENGFVAENPQHDFPKVIRYRFFQKGGMEQIEATISGNGKVISFLFQKIK